MDIVSTSVAKKAIRICCLPSGFSLFCAYFGHNKNIRCTKYALRYHTTLWVGTKILRSMIDSLLQSKKDAANFIVKEEYM